MSNRVVHFEIQYDDIERAKKFYGEVFGWEFQAWPMGPETYWAIMTDSTSSRQAAPKDGSTGSPQPSREPGINGGFVKRPAPAPKAEQGTNAFVCTIQVDNFDEIAQKIEAAGGKVAMPKFAIPGMAWQGYFLDTEGNTFGIHQADKGVK